MIPVRENSEVVIIYPETYVRPTWNSSKVLLLANSIEFPWPSDQRASLLFGLPLTPHLPR